mmetsp:Transcript_8594/g.19106  ORF Transcript_8594/g.19106 Transcript_8594/m.19106 type:complete len:117 (+) Transcript_8594:234-584(+)
MILRSVLSIWSLFATGSDPKSRDEEEEKKNQEEDKKTRTKVCGENQGRTNRRGEQVSLGNYQKADLIKQTSTGRSPCCWLQLLLEGSGGGGISKLVKMGNGTRRREVNHLLCEWQC